MTMPDPPPSKRRTRATQPVVPELLQSGSSTEVVSAAGPSGVSAGRGCEKPEASYAELHCRTNYSFQEGASHADELAARAKDLGYSGLAVTDRNSLAGVVRAHVAAKEAGLKLLVGAEIVPEDGAAMVLLAMDRAGYGRLSRLITLGRRRAEKGACRIFLSDIADASEGLLCGIPLSRETQLRFRREYRPGVNADVPDAELRRIFEIFPDRSYALAELHHGPVDDLRLERWLGQCDRLGLPVAAANDVHFHSARRRPLQDVLTSIRCGVPLQ
ncbi:MAG: polymerase subunit alpha, partial [Planctomycetota bacterium]